MMDMSKRGEEAALDHMNTKILCAKPSIYTAIKKMKLNTFSVGTKVSKKDGKGKIVAMKNSQKLFAKMLLIAKSRDVDIKEIFFYSSRPFPLALATSDGNLV